MSTNQELPVRNRTRFIGKCRYENPNAHRIIDVDCEFSDGKLLITCLPCQCPDLLCIRFTAPADFSAGTKFSLLEREFGAKTSGMDDAPDGLFAAGAVVQCTVDVDRGLVFFPTGGCECDGEEETSPAFTDDQIIAYVAVDGDDRTGEIGNENKPFATFSGARKEVLKCSTTYPGPIVFSIGPGTYTLDADNHYALCVSSYQSYDPVFRATDPADKPVLVSTEVFRGTTRQFENLVLKSHANSVVSVTPEAMFKLADCELHALSPSSYFLAAVRGKIQFTGSTVLDGNGYSQYCCLWANVGGRLDSHGLIIIRNMTNLIHAFAGAHDFSHITSSGLTFQGSVQGKRYVVDTGSVINTRNGDQSHFPGTAGGTTLRGGLYF